MFYLERKATLFHDFLITNLKKVRKYIDLKK